MVAAVALAALVLLILGWRRLEVGAGQVLEQDIEPSTEEVLPALGQMIEQRALVG
jgi:hypothetical protein